LTSILLRLLTVSILLLRWLVTVLLLILPPVRLCHRIMSDTTFLVKLDADILGAKGALLDYGTWAGRVELRRLRARASTTPCTNAGEGLARWGRR